MPYEVGPPEQQHFFGYAMLGPEPAEEEQQLVRAPSNAAYLVGSHQMHSTLEPDRRPEYSDLEVKTPPTPVEPLTSHSDLEVKPQHIPLEFNPPHSNLEVHAVYPQPEDFSETTASLKFEEPPPKPTNIVVAWIQRHTIWVFIAVVLVAAGIIGGAVGGPLSAKIKSDASTNKDKAWNQHVGTTSGSISTATYAATFLSSSSAKTTHSKAHSVGTTLSTQSKASSHTKATSHAKAASHHFLLSSTAAVPRTEASSTSADPEFPTTKPTATPKPGDKPKNPVYVAKAKPGGEDFQIAFADDGSSDAPCHYGVMPVPTTKNPCGYVFTLEDGFQYIWNGCGGNTWITWHNPADKDAEFKNLGKGYCSFKPETYECGKVEIQAAWYCESLYS